MATTYSQAKIVLDEIPARIDANRKRLENAEQVVVTAEADLTAMTAAYAAAIADIAAAAAANPGNAAYVADDAEAALLVAEFQALKTEATAMKDALAAL